MSKTFTYKLFVIIIFYIFFLINHINADIINVFSDKIKVEDYSIANTNEFVSEENKIISFVKFQNFDTNTNNYWIGHSVLTPENKLYNIEAKKVSVNAKQSVKVEHYWTVPVNAYSGEFKFILAIWDSPPGKDAFRLVNIQKNKKLNIQQDVPVNFSINNISFESAGHSLGRGKFLHKNVKYSDTHIVLISEKNSFNGAEVRTTKKYGYGTYQAKIKTDYATGSFSAFFLYQDIDCSNDEIDIEIYNDGTNRIDFVVWKDGIKTNYNQKKLNKTPAENFLVYKIEYLPNKIAFYVDDELLVESSTKLPDSEMTIMFNHWFPNWLDASDNNKESHMLIKEIDFWEF